MSFFFGNWFLVISSSLTLEQQVTTKLHSPVQREVRSTVTTMNKCFVFTILMLAYLVAVVDSQPSYMCQKDDGTKCENKKSPDLRLEFTSDTISDITSKQHYFCDVITKESGNINIIQCNEREISYPISCSEKSTNANREEDVTDDAQNINSAHIAIVAITCFLLGILVAALVNIFYVKRKQQGCFIHNNKSIEVGSRMQSGSDLQSLTTRAIANEYESTDNKNENETVESSYQSLDLDQISKDSQTYDHLEPERPFEHRENKPPYGHQKLTLNNGISANTTPSKIENVYEYERDSQDNENVSRQCKPNSPKQQETQTVAEYMVREVRGENGNTDHVYSVLEPADNTKKMLGRQSDADHNYFVLETVDKVAEVGSG